jgi:hypothetical protein
VLQTYDGLETGVTEDNIDGGVIVNGSWFNLAHPWPLRFLLSAMGWMPVELGASRENHIMRSSSVVDRVTYGKGNVTYSTFDAPAGTVDVLRLAFVPDSVLAEGGALRQQGDSLSANGYRVQRLPNGDAIVTIRHDGLNTISVRGEDPQVVLDGSLLTCDRAWTTEPGESASGGGLHLAQTAGASLSANFIGNQVRLIGRAGPDGGLAEVYLDGEKQRVGVDCWNPKTRDLQVLYYRNGLASGPHELKIVVRGEHNPYSQASQVGVDSVQCSAADQRFNYPNGAGPTETQRMIFGYTGREDYRDSEGKSWRPATEFVIRLGHSADSVKQSWWTAPAPQGIGETRDPELYRYGVHGAEFWTNVTVGPGRYHARLKFAATHGPGSGTDDFGISINGNVMVDNFNVAATAGGRNRAVDLVFNDLAPKNGVIEIRLKGAIGKPAAAKDEKGEAFLQALEVGPGEGGPGAIPKG